MVKDCRYAVEIRTHIHGNNSVEVIKKSFGVVIPILRVAAVKVNARIISPLPAEPYLNGNSSPLFIGRKEGIYEVISHFEYWKARGAIQEAYQWVYDALTIEILLGSGVDLVSVIPCRAGS